MPIIAAIGAIATAVGAAGTAVAGALSLTGLAASMVAGAVTGMIVGAVVGGVTAAITGGDIGKGILMGGLTGAVGGAVGGAISGSLGGAASSTTSLGESGVATIQGTGGSVIASGVDSLAPAATSTGFDAGMAGTSGATGLGPTIASAEGITPATAGAEGAQAVAPNITGTAVDQLGNAAKSGTESTGLLGNLTQSTKDTLIESTLKGAGEFLKGAVTPSATDIQDNAAKNQMNLINATGVKPITGTTAITSANRIPDTTYKANAQASSNTTPLAITQFQMSYRPGVANATA